MLNLIFAITSTLLAACGVDASHQRSEERPSAWVAVTVPPTHRPNFLRNVQEFALAERFRVGFAPELPSGSGMIAFELGRQDVRIIGTNVLESRCYRVRFHRSVGNAGELANVDNIASVFIAYVERDSAVVVSRGGRCEGVET